MGLLPADLEMRSSYQDQITIVLQNFPIISSFLLNKHVLQQKIQLRYISFCEHDIYFITQTIILHYTV